MQKGEFKNEDRLKYAVKRLTRKGFIVERENPVKLRVHYGDLSAVYWINTGWYSGPGIEPGRGINGLIEQLK